MTPSAQRIAQTGQIVRLRSLRAEIAARALARARATLEAAESAVTKADARARRAGQEHDAARAAVSREADLLQVRLDHLRVSALNCAEAAQVAARAGEARDEAADAVRASARALDRARLRHDRLDAEARTLRGLRRRMIEERTQDEDRAPPVRTLAC